MLTLPSKVEVIEVGPRDGFQAEPQWIPTERKIEIIQALAKSGLKEIQFSSFVHPKAVPQLKDADEIAKVLPRNSGVRYSALVPNLRGLQRALASPPDAVHCMMSATESHNRSNGNRSIEDGMREVEAMMPVAKAAGVKVEGGLACVFGCPFEGEVPLAQLDKVIGRYVQIGIRAFNLGDTIGVANPRQVYTICSHLQERFPGMEWTLHLHNTRGMALASILAAIQAGFTRFDGAVGGMGGCPYAPGATGNVATEDVVHMLHEMGIQTGVNLEALLEVARGLKSVATRPLESALVRAGLQTRHAAPTQQEKISN